MKKYFIKECLNNDAKAQEKLYRLFAPKMYGICLRFAKNRMEAEDILQDGFIKIFTNLKYFRNEGSFEGWIRRTIINTAINHYKKNLRDLNKIAIEHINITDKTDDDIISKLSVDELLELINELPDGYRIVFNLNVIEGYTHKEIGKMLNISENTSKSQLSRAKHNLKKKIIKLKIRSN